MVDKFAYFACSLMKENTQKKGPIMVEFIILGVMCGMLFGTVTTMFVDEETAKAAGVEF